ncbi:hypothetical protein M8J77_008372 [Diaphorina citri]|nr:hypothetical protein M8J77_008372 [Diaphorina citri]
MYTNDNGEEELVDLENKIMVSSKGLDITLIFKGLALETMSPFCNEMKIFIDDIGNRLCEKTGDVKAKSFLYQRIGLAVQRGNGASVEGTFPAGDRFDEVFGL